MAIPDSDKGCRVVLSLPAGSPDNDPFKGTGGKMPTGNLGINESLYRALFEQTNDGVFLIGLNLEHIAVNARAADMLGYEAEELIGMSFNDIVALEPLTNSRGDIMLNDEGDQQPLYERIFIRKDGSKFPVEISTSVVNDDLNNPTHVQSIVRDITERKKFENDLQQSEARNRAIVDALPDLVIRSNRNTPERSWISSLMKNILYSWKGPKFRGSVFRSFGQKRFQI